MLKNIYYEKVIKTLKDGVKEEEEKGIFPEFIYNLSCGLSKISNKIRYMLINNIYSLFFTIL